jgi:hypothetical protein
MKRRKKKKVEAMSKGKQRTIIYTKLIIILSYYFLYLNTMCLYSI